jgi:RsiW-degrading membrane proteinase PrsW (M82 family)
VGFLTYLIGLVVLVFTGNPNMFPAIVILGNFLIPVTYVAFFYERRHFSKVRMIDILVSFYYGGFLGTFSAAMLEPIFIGNMDLKGALIVGIIEEIVKIIGVLILIRHKCNSLRVDGIILGAAAGMGFAALESSGYTFTTFWQGGGNLSSAVYTTLLRGVLSPLGHGTWTAILAGSLVSQCSCGNAKINIKVIGAYITVVILHALWDGIPTIMATFTSSYVAFLLGDIAVGLLSIFILHIMWRKGKKQLFTISDLSKH